MQNCESGQTGKCIAWGPIRVIHKSRGAWEVVSRGRLIGVAFGKFALQ